MARDNTLFPVTKKSNPKFVGFATAWQIAANPSLVLAGPNHDAPEKIQKAKVQLSAEEALALNPGKPSESSPALNEQEPAPGLNPADVLRKPKAS